MSQTFARFRHDTAGAFMLMAAIALTALLGLTALAIDGGRAMLERERMQAAADIASLSASITYNKEIRSGKSAQNAMESAIQSANKYYNANTIGSQFINKDVTFKMVYNGAGTIPAFFAESKADLNTTFARAID
jgi:Flp pilus assembly protein TadG